MPTYETAGSDSNFLFQLRYSKNARGWSLNWMQIIRNFETLYSQFLEENYYRTEALAIAYGINRCESLVRAIAVGKVATDDFKVDTPNNLSS